MSFFRNKEIYRPMWDSSCRKFGATTAAAPTHRPDEFPARFPCWVGLHQSQAYALLFAGMRESGYVALAQVAMQRREHVMILRPGKTGMVAHTMFYPDEVRSIQEFRTDVSLATPKELALAKMLIDTLAAPFDPTKFKDTYRERLRELIDSKVQGKELALEQTAPPPNKVIDIMDALQKSLAAMTATKAPPRKSAKSEQPAQKKRQRTMP